MLKWSTEKSYAYPFILVFFWKIILNISPKNGCVAVAESSALPTPAQTPFKVNFVHLNRFSSISHFL